MDEELSFNIDSPSLTLTIVEEPVKLTLDLNSYHASAVPAYTHEQNTASKTWTINHNLGYKPVIQLFDSGSMMVMGTVVNVSNNQTIVTFSKPIIGFARLI